MANIKGLAVISGSADNPENLKHKMLADGDAELGQSGQMSTISGSLEVEGVDENLATKLNTLSGSVASRISTSSEDAGDMRDEINVVSGSIKTEADYTYDAPTGTNHLNEATSLYNADGILDNQLSASRDDIDKIADGDDSVDGSLQNLIKTFLKGEAVDNAWATLQALSSSLAGDTNLRSTITTAIQTMKNEVSDGAPSAETLGAISGRLSDHISQTATPSESGIAAKITAATSSLGLESDLSLSYSNSANFLGDEASLKAGHATLDGEMSTQRTRLTTMTDTTITVATLTVAGAATTTGDVTFVEGKDFTVPTITSTDDFPAVADNGEMLYLEVASGFVASVDYPANNKFYFHEDGVWFPSPFHAED